jgi:O-antigen/teichoic acid export membrane protein
MGFSSAGLIFGNILNMGAGGGALLVSTFRQGVFSYRKLRPRNLLKAFIRYRRYPLLSTPEALLNIAGYQIPIIIIASHAGPEAGFLTLAIQLMAAPMSLLGTSVSQVYISRARKEYQDGRLAFFTISIMKRLVLVGVSPLIILGAVAPIFFPYVFGQNWVRAGEMVSLLTPWMILQFIGSPVSMVMYVVDRQGLMILLTSIGFLLRIGSVLTSIYLINGSPITGLILGNVGYYFTVIGFVIFAAKISSRQFFSLLSVFIDWRVLISLATAFFIYIN